MWLIGSKGVQERIKASDVPIKFLDFAQSSSKLISLGTPSGYIIELMPGHDSRFQTARTACMYGTLPSHASNGLRHTDSMRRSRRSPRTFEDQE